MSVDARARRRVVEEDRLRLVERAWCMMRGARRRERQRIAHAAERFPRRLATIGLPRAERRGPREVQRIGARQPCSAHDVFDRRERCSFQAALERIERFLADAVDVPPPDAQRGAAADRPSPRWCTCAGHRACRVAAPRRRCRLGVVHERRRR